MARDAGLEELVHASLGSSSGLTEKSMFGVWAFLLYEKFLCGASANGLMLRVGQANEAWALEIAGVVPMVLGGRRMKGYVRASAEAYVDDAARQRLMDAAVAFVLSLPRK